MATPADLRGNRLLAGLPPHDMELILPRLERVELTRRQMLSFRDCPTCYAYFVESALLALMTKEGRLQIAFVGAEGMIGLRALFGRDCVPWSAKVTAAGTALRTPLQDLAQLLELSPQLRRRLLHYTYARMEQIAQNAACVGSHGLKERAARWILELDQRLNGAPLSLTHEDFARMLNVRRSGVTEALIEFECDGLIENRRGSVGIRDRSGLEARACSCGRNGKPKAEWHSMAA